eukprot:gene58121-biopygen94088
MWGGLALCKIGPLWNPDDRTKAEETKLREGMKVEVAQSFMSDCSTAVKLVKGQKGKVDSVDDDGDALVDFDAHSEMLWVSQQ